MNIYLDQICVSANMEKSAAAYPSDPKTEAMQTATIGAVGLGTGYLASKIGKAHPSIGAHSGKMAALIGGIGLAGDYAAVKINKKLEKKAMDNKYLEKIAESYQVRGHPGMGRGVFSTPRISLNRPEYHEYVNSVDHHTSLKPVALGAAAGAYVGNRLHNRFATGPATKMRGLHMLAGLAVGANLGNRITENRAHMKALEGMGMVHPHHPTLSHDED